MHTMIQKYIRETYSNVIHYYDVWHVAKGKIFVNKNDHKIISQFNSAYSDILIAQV